MRPSIYKSSFCEIAEQVLANGESLAAVCAEIGIARSTLYEWRDSNVEFRDAIDRGLQKAQREWERIGREGIVGDFDKFNAAPWIFTMKSRFREDYREDKDDKKTVTDSIVEKLIDRLVD